MQTNNKVIDVEMIMDSQVDKIRAYVLIELQPGKEKEFCDLVLSKGLLLDSKVERLDFVHGTFDFVMILYGSMKDIDRRIVELRKFPFVIKTATLTSFEMFDWEDIKDRVHDQS